VRFGYCVVMVEATMESKNNWENNERGKSDGNMGMIGMTRNCSGQ